MNNFGKFFLLREKDATKKKSYFFTANNVKIYHYKNLADPEYRNFML